MAAFSRGFFGRWLAQIAPRRTNICSPMSTSLVLPQLSKARIHRLFSSAQGLQKAKPAKPFTRTPAKPSKPVAPVPQFVGKPVQNALQGAPQVSKVATAQFQGTTLASELLRRRTPTLLYQAPSHTRYRVVTASASLFALFMGLYCLNTIYNVPTPDEWSWWFNPGLALAAVIWIAFAGWFLLSTTRLVKSITAVPPAVSGAPNLLLRFEARRMIPFQRPKIIQVPVQEVKLKQHIVAAIDERTPRAARLAQEYEKEQESKLVPKSGRNFIFNIFSDFRVAFTRDTLIYVKTGHQQLYKIETRDCYMLDNGRALNTLLEVE